MKRLILVAAALGLMLSLLFLGLPSAAQEPEFQLAPPNPDFLKFIEDPPEPFYGEIPPPMDLSHVDRLPVEGLQTDALPSRFDWRDGDKVTPVKNQNPCGTCWAFAATSVLESTVLIDESVAYDFSEQSVALCVDRSWVYLYDDPDDPCDGGGNAYRASEVFIRKGAVLESCNTYDTSALNCDGLCVCDSCPPVKMVDGFRLAAWSGSEIDTIKNAISNKGPLYLAYYHNDYYLYFDSTWGYIYDCYPCSEDANHAVTVVGWDDDVPHPHPEHSGTGAWIIKNSWGPEWRDGGYFYLAYESSCVERIVHLQYKDYVPGEELLYWDEAGFIWGLGPLPPSTSYWMASVFTPEQDGDLTHVDFWTTSNNAQYELYVLNGSVGSQIEELGYQTGSCAEAGYYSIPLDTPISLTNGQQFSLAVEMTTPGYYYPIPVEAVTPGYCEPPIQTGVSFVSTDGSDWQDAAEALGYNVCLRARIATAEEEPILVSIAASPSEVSLNVGGTQQLTITAFYSDLSEADVTADATYASDDESVATVSEAGLITGVAEGTATITVSYTEGEITVTADVPVTVSAVQPIEGELEVHFIDVGQGDSILIDFGDTEILIDGGGKSPGVVAYLADYVDGPIEVMVATHPHADHIGGLIAVLDAFEVEEIWHNGDSSTSQTYEEFIAAVDAEGAEVHIGRRGDDIVVEGLSFFVLHPLDLAELESQNNNSIVLSLGYGELDFLFTGDAEQDAEASMLAGDVVRDIEILKVGHHGSRTSSSQAFLAATTPEVAIYMAGEGNQYGHPHEETITALSEIGAEIYGTDINGTIIVTQSYLVTVSKVEVGPVTWSCPLDHVALIAPYPAMDRQFLSTAVDLSEVTYGDADWFQVLWLDESTGDWKYFLSMLTENTLLTLEPDKYYYVIVPTPCELTISD